MKLTVEVMDIEPLGLERRVPAFHPNFGRVLMAHGLLWLAIALIMLVMVVTSYASDIPGCTVTDRNPCSALWPPRANGARAPRADGLSAFASFRPSAGIKAQVDAAAIAAGVPPRIAHAVVRVESGYKPHVRGRAGEWGLGQIKCQTARGLGFAGPCSALRDPATNLRWSMTYLRMAIERGGAGCAGVSLYNRGIHARPRCTAYGRVVMARVR